MSEELTLLSLLEDALKSSHLWDGSERGDIARAMSSSVTEKILETLIDEATTRSIGERLQEAILSGEDILAAAQQENLTGEDVFAEAFGDALSDVLNEIIEVSESNDEFLLRQRLHEAIIEKMKENTDA